MRYYKLAWFYNAQDELLHILSLKYDPKTPHRAPNLLFGGTEIEAFNYDLFIHQEHRLEDLSYTDAFGIPVSSFRPYIHELVNGYASIQMAINLHTTELWQYLTQGKPLSKIIVRLYEIQDSGQLQPFVEYVFKDCLLFSHQTHEDNYSILFTYCCSNLLFFEGNHSASHKRCTPIEPSDHVRASARGREETVHDNLAAEQKAQEVERLRIVPGPDSLNKPTVHRFDVEVASQMSGKNIPPEGLDDIAFHIVEKPQAIDDLINALYVNPSEVTKTHFRQVNNHLKNGVVLPAQVVLITPEDSIRFSEGELLMKSELQLIEDYRMKLDIDQVDFAEHFIDYGNLAGMTAGGISFGTTYFQQHITHVQRVLKELEEAYTINYRTPAGYLKHDQFKAYRLQKLNELDKLLSKGMKSSFYGGIAGPKNRRKLRLKPELIEHDWRIKQSKILPGLSKFYENTALFSQTLNRVSYLAVPLSAYETHTQIVAACREGMGACTKAKYVEWSGFAGSIGGGFGGAVAGSRFGLAIITCFSVAGLSAVAIMASTAIAGGILAGMGTAYVARGGGETAHDYLHPDDNSTVELETIHEPIWTPQYLKMVD